MEWILITPSYSLLNHFPPSLLRFFPGLSLSFILAICPWFLSVRWLFLFFFFFLFNTPKQSMSFSPPPPSFVPQHCKVMWRGH